MHYDTPSYDHHLTIEHRPDKFRHSRNFSLYGEGFTLLANLLERERIKDWRLVSRVTNIKGEVNRNSPFLGLDNGICLRDDRSEGVSIFCFDAPSPRSPMPASRPQISICAPPLVVGSTFLYLPHRIRSNDASTIYNMMLPYAECQHCPPLTDIPVVAYTPVAVG